MEDLKENLDTIEANFKAAMQEFIRQSGYVEGSLDTIISTTMDVSPEISIVSDKLIKTFHNIEGICKQGLSSEFESLLTLCRELALENQKLKETKIDETHSDLDLAIQLFSAGDRKVKKHINGK